MQIKLSDNFSYKRLMRFILPTVIMMIVSSIYSIVDGFFVSNLVGKNAFAAVNLVMPVIMALASFGFMVGTGGSALIAKTLGKGDKKLANEYFTMLTYVVVVVGAAVSIIGFIFMRQIATALGASEAIIDDCVTYGRILLIGNAFFMLQNAFQSFLVVAEKPKLGLFISIATGVANIFLDFTLIHFAGMGIAGAGFATAISQIIGGSICLIYFSKKNTSLLRFVKPTLHIKALGIACLNGSSEMLSNLSTSIVGILYNFQLMRIAAENGIAAYGVIMYVSFIFMGFFFGYSLGCVPLIGYNYGAENTPELKSLFRKSLTITAIVSLSMTILGVWLATPLAHIFVGYDAELLEMTANGLRLYSLSFLLCGFNIFGSALFTALNNGTISAIISFSRTLVIQTASVIILPMIFGINGIWLAIVVAEGVTLILTISLFIKYRKKYKYI